MVTEQIIGFILLIIVMVMIYSLYKKNILSGDGFAEGSAEVGVAAASSSEMDLNAAYSGARETAGKPELVLYKADWCGYCVQFRPLWEQLKAKYGAEILFTEVDIDKIAAKMSVPTIAIKKSSQEIKFTGNRTEKEIIEFARKHAKSL